MSTSLDWPLCVRPITLMPRWLERWFYRPMPYRRTTGRTAARSNWEGMVRGQDRVRGLLRHPDGRMPTTGGFLYAFGWAVYREILRDPDDRHFVVGPNGFVAYLWRFGRMTLTSKP